MAAYLPKPMVLSSSLGDALLFHRMRTREELGRLYEFEVEAQYEGDDDGPAKLLGEPACVLVEQPGGKTRHFHGIVSQVGPEGAPAQGLAPWRLVLRPSLWLLTLRADTRIFQAKTVPAILQEVFDLYALDVKFSLQGNYPAREYCVQYNESDFNFASRLMEQEGIGYFFVHEKSRHTLTLFDKPGAHPMCPGQSAFHFGSSQQLESHHDTITSWHARRRVGSGKVELSDYDWKRPSTVLRSSAKATDSWQPGRLEQYDYAIHFTQAAEGDRYAGVRLQEAGARLQQVEGAGPVRALTVGHRFKLEQHPVASQNGEYLVVSTEFDMTATGYYSGEDAQTRIDCRFVAMPSAVPWRSERTSQRTRVQGPHTARVVGPAGEEIFTDEHGRVKVHFHWDRLGHADENSSCWVRVATPWAGAMRGWVSVPRIGDEVVVDFLEGDPDRPIIVGSVWNGTNVPPWQLPANRTQSGLLTRSSPGGAGNTNANVLRFEDKKGSEEVWLHAEKDNRIEVENDENHDVGHDRTKSIGNDESTSIGRDRKEEVGRDETISIGKNRTETVGADEKITIADNRTESVGKNETIDIGKDRTENVGDNESVSIGKNRKHEIGKDATLSVGENRTTQVGKDDKLQVGKKFMLTAADEITLVTGSASLTMKKDGTIQLKGKDITVTGSGKIGIKASGDVVVKGSKIAQN